MTDLPKNQTNSGIKWFGQKLLIESSGDKYVDAALKSTFKDKFLRTAPLEMRRHDVQILLDWQTTRRCSDCYWFQPKKENENGMMLEEWCKKIKRHRCARSKQAKTCKFYKRLDKKMGLLEKVNENFTRI